MLLEEKPNPKAKRKCKKRCHKIKCQRHSVDFFKKHAFDTDTVRVCVCVWVCQSTQVGHKMIGAIRFIRQSVSLATVTYPSPPTLVILRRKSTELRLGGFHLRMSSHLPALYLCRENWRCVGINTYEHCFQGKIETAKDDTVSRWIAIHFCQRLNIADLLNAWVIGEPSRILSSCHIKWTETSHTN